MTRDAYVGQNGFRFYIHVTILTNASNVCDDFITSENVTVEAMHAYISGF